MKFVLIVMRRRKKKEIRLPKILIDISRYPYLLTYEPWLLKRDEILKRDNYKCCRCGLSTVLQVHHLYYDFDRFPWEYENDAYETLCWSCHEVFHEEQESKFCVSNEIIKDWKRIINIKVN